MEKYFYSKKLRTNYNSDFWKYFIFKLEWRKHELILKKKIMKIKNIILSL